MRRLLVLTVASWLLIGATASAQDGRMVIEQRTIPAGAGQMFGYDGEAWSGGFFLRDGMSRGQDVPAGTYFLVQSEVTDWDMVDVTCDDDDSSGEPTVREITFVVDPGETVTCTATNDQADAPPAGSLEIVAVAEGADPSTRFAFTGDAPVGAFTLAAGQVHLNSTLSPGEYAVGTMGAEGYDLTNMECDDTGGGTPSVVDWENAQVIADVEPGEAVGCTFTFAERAAIVVRAVGGEGAFAFSSVTAAPDGFTVAAGDEVELDVPAGEHRIEEAAPPDGILLDEVACDDGDSSGELAARAAVVRADPGERVTCTFTHALPAPEPPVQRPVTGQQPPAGAPAAVQAPPRACVSRRHFTIRLPRRATRRSARVWVDGVRVPVRRRDGRLVATVDLRGKPAGQVAVRVRARTAAGRTLRQLRRYRTC